MNDIKILVVDDSSFMRKIISNILEELPELTVVATARDGIDALSKIEFYHPDVVTLDVDMPRMNGIDTLKEIMFRFPLPVVMVSSLTKDGAAVTMKALSMGAVDFVSKPSGAISLNMQEVDAELRTKVLAAALAQSTVPGRPFTTTRIQKDTSRQVQKTVRPVKSGIRPRLVCIASSTGGPQALQKLLTLLPSTFPLPVVIAQHMPKGFTASFASHLNDLCALHVVEGYEGLPLQPGMVVIAPGGFHMIVKGEKNSPVIGLSDAPPLLSVKPSANILFLSVADVVGGDAVAVILTGMGRDGTDGAQALISKGAYVFGESPESCVIYGMPKAAMEAGVVNEQLPLQNIAEALNRFVRENR
ncbi:MAG: chemotaxis response regulator protein-glutamate methylesterase [Dethiosulfovibrio peptidovorans]|nr:MAG: chemotaxis response regulator protein-glutamate methylesterase [Dethiosulfovibrio peptidovorans]